jgi:N-acetyltransferase 10
LLNETIKPTKKMKPLLKKVSEIKPVNLHYLGTSFGMTKELFRFWKKNTYFPVYLRYAILSIFFLYILA